MFDLLSLLQLLWVNRSVVLCGVFALFSSLQVYHFVYPKATKSPESRDPTQYFCQAMYSPNLSLSTRLRLLPAVLKYRASLAVRSLLVFGRSVWSALRYCFLHQVRAVTRCVLLILQCTSSCPWIPGIALLHQLACLWYFVVVWLHQVSTSLPPRAHRRFAASRLARRRLARSGWAWKLFCTAHFFCWVSSVAYQGCSCSFVSGSLPPHPGTCRLSARARLFHDCARLLHTLASDSRGWDVPEYPQRGSGCPLKRLQRESQGICRRFTAYQAYNNNNFTIPRYRQCQDLEHLASLPTGWADDNDRAPSCPSTDAMLKGATNAAVFEFTQFMQRRYDAFHLHQARTVPDDEEETLRSTHISPDLFQVQSVHTQQFAPTPRRLNKYGVTDLHTQYGNLAPKRLVHGSSKCLALSDDTKSKQAALRSTVQMSCRSATKQDHCTDTYSICIDTGCSITITNCLNDFKEPPTKGNYGTMKTIDGTSNITAFGIINWQVYDDDGTIQVIETPAYYIPSSDQRLFSPQHYGGFHGWSVKNEDMFGGNHTRVWVLLAEPQSKICPRIEAPISAFDSLPYITGYTEAHLVAKLTAARKIDCGCSSTCDRCSSVANAFDTAFNMEVLSEANENLTPSQKELLLDHQRIGHINMSHLQELYRPRDIDCEFDGCSKDSNPCLPAHHAGVSSCDQPMCLACAAARSHRRPTGATHSKKDPERQNVVAVERLQPGDQIHVDNYESSVRGHLTHTYGKEKRHQRYCGGTIFYDASIRPNQGLPPVFSGC